MKIIEYEPSRKKDLIRLNVWWIERYFGQVEAADREEFDHIDEEIAKGGMTFFAVDDDGEALATCTALDRGYGEWEIAKLGSDPDRPHKGCGTAVFEACVNWARDHGAKRIFILTNSTLSAAIHIYESHGFTRIYPKDFGGYARGDYALEKRFD
ncbi:MAG: GNAT family N-acetyltransferase [Denitrobacterium sp.]|jgi:putative acetyltransferase|nr:GNAT family N-acetyltransferase [Denitrobacterium sp.]